MQQKKLILAFLIGALTIPASQADENTPRQQRNKRAQMAEEAAAKKTTSERRAQKSSRDQGKGEQEKDSQTDNTAPSAGDAVKLRQDFVKDALTDLNIRPEIAGKIAAEANDPATAPEAQTRIEQITGAAADLDLVSVDPKVRNAVVDKVSRSEKPKDTANEEVGKAAIDEVFGKDVTKLLPADKVPQARDVFVNLAKIQAALVTVGGDPNGKEVKDAVEEGAKLGVVNDDDARKVMEDGAHKILDKTFPPAKPGEKLGDRLARMAKEQEKLQAELNAKKAADAARAAAKARLAAAAKISKDKLGGSLTQGAAGSTAAGRSVSARLQVALGGGKGAASGAGTAKLGTGIVTSQTSGAGGNQTRQDLASARLAAGPGGPTNNGKPATDSQPTTQPGNNTTQPAESTSSAPVDQHTPQSPILSDSDVNTPATTQTAATPAQTTPAQNTPESGGNQPRSGTVSSPSSEFKMQTEGGNRYLVDAYHADATSERGATNTQVFSDGTFRETETVSNGDGTYTTTVTTGTWAIDGNGNVVVTSATTSPGTTTGSGQGGNNNTDQQNNTNQQNNNNQSSNDKDGDGKDDDDDKDDDDKSDDDKQSEEPPPAEETAADDTEAAKSEESKQSSSTPNPMDIGGGDPTQLAARSGGRIGNQEARRQQRGLDLARFGGAAGPSRDGKGGAPSLLTPEEKANAQRALNMRLGGGVTNPNPLGKGNVVATDRDLKELHLRGNGGAKGPTESTAPATPQDPHSPLGSVGPAPVPAGGTRINGATAKGAAIKSQIKLDGQVNTDAVKSTVK